MTVEDIRRCSSRACAAASACGRRADEPATPAPARNASAAEAAAHGRCRTPSKVDEGMLRDLRITTRAVESRPGGEQVTLLGELAVDRARLRRSRRAGGGARHAPARQRRRHGAQRARRSRELTSPELGRRAPSTSRRRAR